MRDRLITLIASMVCDAYSSCADHGSPSCETCCANNCCIGELADYLFANGVIVPPCKVGDTVWFELYGQIESAVIHNCAYELSRKGCLLTGAYAKDTRGIELSFDENTIGKTIFLTREEAEQELKGAQHEE